MEKKLTLEGLAKKVENVSLNLNTLLGRIEGLEASNKELTERLQARTTASVRDRGPLSTRDMTEADARRVMVGDMRFESHRTCAEKLGLSYGQIYSARGGYTFKGVYKELQDLKAKEAAEKEKAALKTQPKAPSAKGTAAHV